MENDLKKIKVLFVCLGNICRSPSAEAVMNGLVKRDGLADKIVCDSAGILSAHAGEPADMRMQRHAVNRDYFLTSISRQITSDDFEAFDYVVGMDDENILDMQSLLMDELAKHEKKISKMTDYCSKENPGSVPDPYYGGEAGFELVLDILEDACEGLLTHIKNEYSL